MLIDTGPLVALFNDNDRYHEHYREIILATGPLHLLTVWPCVVEAAYLLRPDDRFDMLDYIERGGVQIYPFEPRHLADMLPWMRKYTESPKCEMDFADAALYWLAVDTGITAIMTLDRRDFERYRLPGGQGFEIV